MLQFGQGSRRHYPDHLPPRVKLAIKRFDFVRLARAIEPDVKRRENPPIDRQQMRGKDEIFRGQAEMLGNFGRVAMGENVVSAEILIYFDKLRIALWFLARACN